jgi:hypothetical protein
MQAERQQRAEAQGLRYADLVLLSCAVLCCAVLCCALNLPAVRPAALTVLDCANPPTAYHTNTVAYLAACSEHLKQEGERRAKQFQAAVQTAVGKIQSELETERDALQAK